MNILGVGGWELIAIFVIALVVAGPERMIRWAYHMGRYVAYVRQMWGTMMQSLQKELERAGLDVPLPEKPPTPRQLRSKVNQLAESVTRPVSQPFSDANKALQRALSDTGDGSDDKAPDVELGTWSDQTQPPPPSNTSNDLGTWSIYDPVDDD